MGFWAIRTNMENFLELVSMLSIESILGIFVVVVSTEADNRYIARPGVVITAENLEHMLVIACCGYRCQRMRTRNFGAVISYWKGFPPR